MINKKALSTLSNIFLLIVKILIAIFIFLNVIKFGCLLLSNIGTHPMKYIDKEDIIYHTEINEKVRIDDRIIVFTDIFYENGSVLDVCYKSYDTRLWGLGWSFSYIGEFKDDLGNTIRKYSGSQSGGFVTKGCKQLKNFSKDANELIIEYDRYNRYYKVVIPLNKEENYE